MVKNGYEIYTESLLLLKQLIPLPPQWLVHFGFFAVTRAAQRSKIRTFIPTAILKPSPVFNLKWSWQDLQLWF